MIKIASQQQMKQINTKTVFRLIHLQKTISRASLAKMTSLSPTTISAIVEDLIDKRMVVERSPMESTGVGRKAITLEINDSCKYMIGMELDRQGVSGTVFNLKNEPIFTVTESFHDASMLREEIPVAIISIIHKLIEMARGPFEELIGICIGVGAMLDTEKKSIVFSTPFNIGDIHLYDRLRLEFNYPLFIENETLLSAGAERERMEIKPSHFVYLAINDGLGISVIMNNRYLEGMNGEFLELGHMSLNVNGARCACGNYGCFELYVSIGALFGKVKQYRQQYPDSAIFGQRPDEPERFDEKNVALALQGGDPLAQKVVREMGIDLGNGLVNLIHAFNPATIVIGGKLSILGDELLEHARGQVRSRAFKLFAEKCAISLASYKGSVTSVGAAIFALNKVLEQQIR